MIESYMGPTAAYAGSNSERQSVGLPGHCVACAEHGHVIAHPDLGCGDVGCSAFHDEPSPTSTPTTGAAETLVEPARWSVIADTAERIWLRIGDDLDGEGLWLNTGQGGPRFARFADLSVTCVLALGLDTPLAPGDYRADLARAASATNRG